jgi:hypothetical protein
MLHVGIRFALDDLLHRESRRLEEEGDLVGTEQDKVHRDALAPPFVEMDDAITDMEGQEQQSTRLENALDLDEGIDDSRTR